MGRTHGTAVVNGRVETWGIPEYQPAIQVPQDALSGVIAVASGLDHNIAIKRIDAQTTQLIRWGDPSLGLGSVADRRDVVAVATTYVHVLALTTSGSVLFWGDDRNGGGAVPPEAASGIVAIAVGDEHSMALTSDGRVLAWGGVRGESNVPVEAQSDVIKIDAGAHFCVALRRDGRVVAWGQIPEGDGVPTTPAGMDTEVVDIVAIANGFAARKVDGSILSWVGPQDYGALNIPAFT
jgi:alpha-tubulin suppressor-like RCC1 family protein